MSSVSPLSSASNVSDGTGVGPVCPVAPGFLYVSDDCDAWSSAQLAVAVAYYRALEAYNVAMQAGGSVSVVSSSEESAVSGSSRLSKSARRRRRRGSRVSGVGGVRESKGAGVGVDGYLACVKVSRRVGVQRALGKFPAMVDVMKLSLADLLPMASLLKLRCDVVDGQLLVHSAGSLEFSAVVAAVASVCRTGVGTLGAVFGYGESDCGYVSSMVVPVKPVVPDLGHPGRCYLRLIQDVFQLSASSVLGVLPTVQAVLQSPVEWFDMAAVSGKRAGFVDGFMHVDDVSCHSVMEVLTAMAKERQFGPGSLGSILAHRDGVVVEGPGLSLSTLVGLADVAILTQAVASKASLHLGSSLRDGVSLVVASNAMLGPDEKRKRRLWEAVGDSVLSTTIATATMVCGLTVADYQNARSALTSNDHLARFAVAMGLGDYVQMVAGVEFRGRVAAGTFEALLGCIYEHGGMAAVVRYCRTVGFYTTYEKFSAFSDVKGLSLGWFE